MAILMNIMTVSLGDVVKRIRIEFKETWDVKSALKQFMHLPIIWITGERIL